MRYQLIQLMQLLFALSLIFGAFAGGIAVGWLRWGRGGVVPPPGEGERPTGPVTLFCPEGRDDEVVIAEIDLDITDSAAIAGPMGGDAAVFTPGPLGAGAPAPPQLMGLTKPAAAIASPWDQDSLDVETLEA